MLLPYRQSDLLMLPRGIAIGMGSASAIALVCGAWMLARARATNHWRAVEGEIINGTLVRYTRGTYSLMLPERSLYRARLEYSYSVAGKEYTASRIYFGANEWQGGNEDRAHEFLLDYPRGARVQVYVDPDRPTESVLVRGHDNMGKAFLQISAVAAVIAVLAWLVSPL